MLFRTEKFRFAVLAQQIVSHKSTGLYYFTNSLHALTGAASGLDVNKYVSEKIVIQEIYYSNIFLHEFSDDISILLGWLQMGTSKATCYQVLDSSGFATDRSH